MQPDPNPTRQSRLYNQMTGMSGLEDTVNAASARGCRMSAGADHLLLMLLTYSPEDVNGDNVLDTLGEQIPGSGLRHLRPARWLSLTTSPARPTVSRPARRPAQWNMVTGPRHSLRLVDGGMDAAGNSYLPQPIAPATSGNGFTVVSEEPVYVYGDYNSGSGRSVLPLGGRERDDSALGGCHHCRLSDPALQSAFGTTAGCRRANSRLDRLVKPQLPGRHEQPTG